MWLGIWCTCFSLCKLTWGFLSILIHGILTKIYQSEDSVNSHGSYGDGFPRSSSYLYIFETFPTWIESLYNQ